MKNRLSLLSTSLLIFSSTFFFTSCSKEVVKKWYLFNESIGEGFDDPVVDVDLDEFKKTFSVGDIIEMTVVGKDKKTYTCTLPYVSEFSEAGYYAPCIADYDFKGKLSVDLSLAMWPYGQRISTSNFFGQEATFKLKEKGGYNNVIELVKVSEKMKYDQTGRNPSAFANFRDVSDVGSLNKFIKKGVLFRSSAPFTQKDSNNRHEYVNELMKINNIKFDICLSKSKSKFESIIDSLQGDLYIKELKNKGSYKSISFGTDYFTESAIKDVKEVLLSIINSDSSTTSFLIHCNEGKDRTGFFLVLLEALAPENTAIKQTIEVDDIIADFMISYKNYYNISLADNINRYRTIRDLTVYRHIYSIMLDDPAHDLGVLNWLDKNFDVRKLVNDKLKKNSLQYYAEQYVKRIGITNDQLNILKQKLYV